MVANDMRRHALVKEDLESFDIWQARLDRNTLEIFETYGIELPGISYIKQRSAA